jgi:hypothetical protein
VSPKITRRRSGHASLPLARIERDKLEFGPVQIPRAADRAAFADYLRSRRQRAGQVPRPRDK